MWIHRCEEQGRRLHAVLLVRCCRKHEALAGRLAPAAPEAVQHAHEHVHKVFRVLAAELREAGDYLLGDSGFSAADILLVHCCDWAQSIGWSEQWADGELNEDMAHFAAYLARCRARAPYVAAKVKE